MKLYFCLSLFWTYHPCTLHFFVCCAHHRPVRDLCGWLFSLDCIVSTSGGDTLGAASLKGNVRHFGFFFNLIWFSAVASLWFCKTVQNSFLFVRLMKTIHVNITSKKNVYFYDFWVITLSFANKIFNDNLNGLVASWFSIFENTWQRDRHVMFSSGICNDYSR